jgi:hypothetical protein
MGITMRGGKLRCVTLIMTTGREPKTTSSIWVQEWFDVGAKNACFSRKQQGQTLGGDG